MFQAQARYVRVTVTGLPAGVYASIRNLEVYDRPFTADLGTYKVINRNSGKALDVSNASTADGATLIQWPYGGGTNQQWSLLPNTDGSFRLANVKSGKLLQSPNSTQGTTLTQESDNGGDNQWWKLVPSATSGYYRLVNVRTGWCADVANASTTDGTNVIQWPVTMAPTRTGRSSASDRPPARPYLTGENGVTSCQDLTPFPEWPPQPTRRRIHRGGRRVSGRGRSRAGCGAHRGRRLRPFPQLDSVSVYNGWFPALSRLVQLISTAATTAAQHPYGRNQPSRRSPFLNWARVRVRRGCDFPLCRAAAATPLARRCRVSWSTPCLVSRNSRTRPSRAAISVVTA